MTIALTFSSWHLPLAITLIGFFGTIFVAWRESKTCGDFGLPIYTLLSACCGFTATITAWVFYFLLR